MLAPIFLMIISVALLGLAFWLWPRHPPDTTTIPAAPPRNQPAAPLPESKTEYISREDIFRSAESRSPPPSGPTEVLTRPMLSNTAPTECLSRDDILAPSAPPTNAAGRDPDDMRPTRVFNRETIASIINKP